jgi:hypothetical protein
MADYYTEFSSSESITASFWDNPVYHNDDDLETSKHLDFDLNLDDLGPLDCNLQRKDSGNFSTEAVSNWTDSGDSCVDNPE